MKLMVIRAVENRSERDVILNPALIESIETSDAMSKVTTASGRTHFTETPLGDLYTAWMLMLNPDVEYGYNVGAANTKAQLEKAMLEKAAVAQTEEAQSAEPVGEGEK